MLYLRRFFIFTLCAVLFTSLFPISYVSAQATATDAVSIRKAQLQSQLDDLNKQIAAQQTILTQQTNQRETLQRDVAILDAQIKQAQLSIQARNLQIQSLTDDITSKQGTIQVLSDKIDREKDSLADLLRKTNDLDSSSLIEVVLSNKTFADFFADIDSYSSIKGALQDSYDQISTDKNTTQTEESALQDKKDEQVQLLQIQKLQQQRMQQDETQKNKIVALSKGVEAQYQTILKQKQQTAASIRAELFSLNGSAAIPFEKALQYAKEVSTKTGVRPAFILGIIAEESDLGANVGTGNWKVDMKAPRDTVPFQTICSALGLNPDNMPVSKKPWYGYGGAMGPAQFIPSTWVLYQDKIAALTGDKPPNPWDARDAFFATGILSKENGAAGQTLATERLSLIHI